MKKPTTEHPEVKGWKSWEDLTYQQKRRIEGGLYGPAGVITAMLAWRRSEMDNLREQEMRESVDRDMRESVDRYMAESRAGALRDNKL